MQKLAVSVFQHTFYSLVETIIDKGLDEFYMLPVHYLKFAFDHKTSMCKDLQLDLVEFCIFPPELTEAERQDPAAADFFSIQAVHQNYETLLQQVISDKACSDIQKKAAYHAMFALHCIHDEAKLSNLLPLDDMLPYVAFMLPKVKETRDGGK